MAVRTGDKFAVFLFPRCRHLNLPVPVQVAPELSVERGPVVELDAHWTSWLGSSRSDHLGDNALVFVARRPSPHPLIVDVELRELQRAAQSLMYACLLGGIPDYQPEGLMLSGGVGPNGVEIREIETLHTFFRHPAPMTIPVVDNAYAQRGGQRVAGIVAAYSGTDTLRFRRGFNAWLRGVSEKSASRKLHQFVRSLDGVLKLPQGASRRTFVERCQDFATSSNPQLVLNELYELRSVEEHLNDWSVYLNPIAGTAAEVRYRARAWQAEKLASTVYGRLFENATLRAAFADDTSTDAFWKQTAPVREAAWGLKIDLDLAATECGYAGP